MSLLLEYKLKLNDISPDLIVAANRFNETIEDGQEYDVLPRYMTELEGIGLVENKGNGIFFQTDLMMEVKQEIKTLSDQILGKDMLECIKSAIVDRR